MPEVPVDRSSLLQQKRLDISLTTTSRKRKLRELYAVYSSYSAEQPIPFVAVNKLDDYPTTIIEEQFLNEHDILQKLKPIEEAIPPTRRQLRSDTAKGPSRGAAGLEGRSSDSSRISSKALHEDVVKKSRGSTPAKEGAAAPSNGLLSTPDISRRSRSASRLDVASTKSRRGSSRASSRGSQTDLPASSTEILDTIVDESIAETTRENRPVQDDIIPPGVLEEERIEDRVESPPGSPGVDPRKAIPISVEDAINLSEPIINGAQDENHNAATVHLPPKEVQEKRLREAKEHRAEKALEQKKADEGGSLSIRLPPPHGSRNLQDPMSSPGSTLDAQSATTPAQHEASTDTSPDNEGPRYRLDRPDEKEEIPETPSANASEKDDAPENPDEDGGPRTELDGSRGDNVGGTPNAIDAQLRLEEEQAAAAAINPYQGNMSGDSAEDDAVIEDGQKVEDEQPSLTSGAEDLVQDILEDDEQAASINASEAEINLGTDATAQRTSGSNTAVDAMDVDSVAANQAHTDVSLPGHELGNHSDDPNGTFPSEAVPATKNETSTSSILFSAPRRTPSAPVPTPPTLERMTTRVASGAMRQKSISEILGEIPRPNTSGPERAAMAKGSADPDSAPNSTSHSRSMTPQSPGSRLRTIMERGKEKERSKLSTVVFAKQPNDRSSSTALVPSSQRAQAVDQPAEYFMPLIVLQAAHQIRQPHGPQSLEALLQQAHKTVTTSNLYVPVHEQQTMRVLRRIFRLQQDDRWSLRQPKRCPEPNRPSTHWDELLKEAKWMRTDFREERKWKMAVARNLAYDCAEWVEADAVDRKELQVNSVIPQDWRAQADTEMQDASSSAMNASHPTPDLDPSAEGDSPIDEFEDEPRSTALQTVAPATMFTLSDDDVVFGLRRSPATDSLLQELPLYGVPLKVPESGLSMSDVDPDASWRRPALPLSKYMDGKIVLLDEGPPKKKSRYHYEEEDDDDDQVVFGVDGAKRASLPPVLTHVALFNPENKHIRDRIHAGHQFRPPSENPMPLQSFFECRTASQWTWPEDDELKALVREYSYNWQLISCLLTSPSMYTAGSERRTPWECFERWIHLEGLPADMQKTHYFRAYNNRLEAAQRTLMAMAQQVPQPNAAGAMMPSRRRSTTSIRVDRRRNQKHLTLVDAMRKLAKKRETSMQKQLQAAQIAEQRKKGDPAQQQSQNQRHTPQDFSRLKHEREQQFQERVSRLHMQQEAQRRAALASRNLQANPQQFAASNNGNAQQPRNPTAPNAGPGVNVPPNGNRPNQLTVPGQNMPRPQMQQPMPNGMVAQVPIPNPGNIPQMPMNGMPQGQMNGMPGLPNVQGVPGRLPVPNTAPNIQLVMQARQLADQQRHAIAMQQNQQHPGQALQGHNSPPNMRANMNGNMNGMNQQNYIPTNAMMAAFNAANMNGSTPPPNGFNAPNPGSSSSPRMNHPNQPQQMQNSAAIAKLEANLRVSFPTYSPEAINKMARDQFQIQVQMMAQQRANAMQAAAGTGAPLQSMPNGMQNSPQQYAQMLRAQQEKQAAAAQQQGRSASASSASGNNGMPK